MKSLTKPTFWTGLVSLLLIILSTACNPEVGGTAQPPAAAATSQENAPANATASATTTAAAQEPSLTPPAPTIADSPTPGAAAPTAESATAAPGLPPASASQATRLPDPAGFEWRPVISGGLSYPIGLENAGDGTGRLFALEKEGRIRILREGEVLPEPFLDIADRVGSSGSEQGLLGLAFHPRFKENGYFYVNYTDRNGDTVIARFQATQDPDRADPDSEAQLLQVDQPYANHNGGGMAFAPDGTLILGLGDGGSGGDPQGNGQSLQTRLGKLLRIDVDGGEPYAIPPDNPFASQGGLPEIWHYGLRNPWRFAFDRLTGDLYIADVGQNRWEEIDFLPAGTPGGVNFGWNYREGSHPFEGNPPGDLALVDPVAEYDHSQGCSVTGGTVYRGPSLPEFQGVYLYGDFCSGHIWGLLRLPDGSWQNERLFAGVGQITSFGADEAGEIYLVDPQGNINRLSRK